MSVTARNEVPVPGEGRLAGIPVPELVAALGKVAWNGSLVLERGGIRKVLYFREGRLVFSASTDPDDRLGAHLLRQGDTSLADLVEASGEVARGRRLGQILVERGAMDARALTRAVLEQVREIALSVFAWEEGTFRVSRARLPEDESITLDLPWEELVLEGIRRVESWDRVRRATGGPGAAWRLAPDVEGTEPPGAGRVERALLAALRNPRRVAALAREVYAPALEVYRSLWALGLLGFAVRLSPDEIPPALLDVGEGLLDEEGPVRLLLDLADRRVDGAVSFRDGDREVVLHLRGGRVVHAWRPFHPSAFLDWLLARGFLSDRDHARALSRAAAGSSFRDELLERERLTAEELGFLFPEFSREVAREVLLWRRGEIAIAEGEPVPPVPLFDATVEDLVVEAFETSAAFENVWRALGSLDTLFRLRPEYLDRMDRMTLRPVLWDIVSLLGRERTLGEILAAREEPDALLLRLLRAMELVGIVERVPQAELVARLRDRGTPEAAQVLPPAPPAAAPAGETGNGRAGEGEGVAGEDAEEQGSRRVPIEAPSSAREIAPELFGETGSGPAPEAAPGAAAAPPSADPARTLEVPRDLVERALRQEGPVPSAPEGPLPAPGEGFPTGEEPAAGPPEGETVAEEREPAPVPPAPEGPPPAPGEGFPAGEEPAAGPPEGEAVVEEQEPAPVPPVPDEPPPAPEGEAPGTAPSPELLAEVDRFLGRHRVVWRALRLEIGAGVRNFVLTCQRNLAVAGDLFDGLEPGPEGEYGRDELARRLAARPALDPRRALDDLVETEIRMIRGLVHPASLREIERGLAEIP